MKSSLNLLSLLLLLFLLHHHHIVNCFVFASLHFAHPVISSAASPNSQSKGPFSASPSSTSTEYLSPPQLPPSLAQPLSFPHQEPVHQSHQLRDKPDPIPQETISSVQCSYLPTQSQLHLQTFNRHTTRDNDNVIDHSVASTTNSTVIALGRHPLVRRGDGECTEDECQAQSDACLQRSILVCQQARRRGPCREKFARRCRIDYFNCAMHCLLSSPDPDSDLDSDPYPP